MEKDNLPVLALIRQKLLAKKYPIVLKRFPSSLGGGKQEVVSYVFHDEHTIAKLIKSLDPALSVRIWLPTSVGTRDVQMSRVNVKINAQGIVSEIWLG